VRSPQDLELLQAVMARVQRQGGGGEQQPPPGHLDASALAAVLWACALLRYLPPQPVLALAQQLAQQGGALKSPEVLRQVMHAGILAADQKPRLGAALRRELGGLYGRCGRGSWPGRPRCLLPVGGW
jgi:hypothetical protein